jgi:hypothetical protein
MHVDQEHPVMKPVAYKHIPYNIIQVYMSRNKTLSRKPRFNAVTGGKGGTYRGPTGTHFG